jgi:hypothetical protein
MSELLQQHHTDNLGNVWRLATIMAPPKQAWPVFGSTPSTPLVPRSEWQGLVKDNQLDQLLLPPIANQGPIGMCFPAGTLIRMADGSQRPIQDVKVGELVLTAERNIRRVLKTMVRTEDSSLYKLHVWGHRHLRGTAEHPILTQRGYVPLAELTNSDYIAIPKYIAESKTVIMTNDYISVRYFAGTANIRSTHQIPGKRATTVTRHPVPDAIHLTRDFGWIIGLFLAEGSTCHGKATWVLGLHELETHAAKLVTLLKKCLGIDAHIRTKPSNNVTIVTVHGVQWAKLFEAWCSTGCSNKKLHCDLASAPQDFLEGVLEGWTDGDGLGDEYNGGVTTSHSLSVQMFDIANRLNYCPTIETLDVKTYGAVKTRLKRYIMRWGHFPEKSDPRRYQDDAYLWRKVDGVVREDFTGDVYNLEVEDDHSYVAEGIGVHNCNCSGTASALEHTRLKSGLPYKELSGGDLYRRICYRGQDNGSLLEDGIREAMENGIPSTDVVPYLEWRRDYGQPAIEDRKKYRVLEAYLCPTFDHMMSAVLQGFSLISAIMWYDNYTPDSRGWLPTSSQGDPGGHAFFGYAGMFDSRTGNFGIANQNSWTARWGVGGRFVVPEALYRNNYNLTGHWAVRSVVQESGDIPAPAQ